MAGVSGRVSGRRGRSGALEVPAVSRRRTGNRLEVRERIRPASMRYLCFGFARTVVTSEQAQPNVGWER